MLLEMLRDCSERMGNPTLAITLTSVDPDRPLGRVWSKDVEAVFRAIRRREPCAEYAGFMEWTTGRGARSGGRRRPHQHLLVRGVDPSAADALEDVVRGVWEPRTASNRVEVAPLRANEAGTAYLALHHRKEDQAPPETFRGRRLRTSQSWWGADAKQLRQSARERLRTSSARHALRKALQDDLAAAGLTPDDLDPDQWGELLAASEAATDPPRVVRVSAL